MITLETLVTIMPYSAKRAAAFIEPINDTLREFDINTGKRAAAFLAQVAHESGELRYTRELASGEAYDTGRLAAALGNTPAADGDGQRYKGRGLIQITGRANYKRCGTALDLDLINDPALLEQPVSACRSAGWFWQSNGLNDLADRAEFRKITRRINGGYNGMEDRLKYYERAMKALGVLS